jgi:hypothetical protein
MVQDVSSPIRRPFLLRLRQGPRLGEMRPSAALGPRSHRRWIQARRPPRVDGPPAARLVGAGLPIVDVEPAHAMVARFVNDAGRIGSLLETASASDTRDLLRSIVQEVGIDPDKGETGITLYAMPRFGDGPAEAGGPGDGGSVSSSGAPTNEERTRPAKDMSSHMYMAGARLVGRKRTCRIRVIRKPWLLHRSRRRVAV